MYTKHRRRNCVITVLALLFSLSCSNGAIGADNVHVALIPAPKTLLAVHSGLWRGEAVMTTNGHQVIHTLSVCVQHPRHFISTHTGAKVYGGYFPPTCKISLLSNTTHSLAFREVCVPPQYLHGVVKHPDRFHKLAALPAYLFKYYSITINQNQNIQVTTEKSEKAPRVNPTRNSGYAQGASNSTPKTFSQTIHGTFGFVSSTCGQPIKVPTNKELRAEGKTVYSNHKLNEKLKSRFGYNPSLQKSPHDTNKGE